MSMNAAIWVVFKTLGLENGKERHLSYLPLAHMFERVAQVIKRK